MRKQNLLSKAISIYLKVSRSLIKLILSFIKESSSGSSLEWKVTSFLDGYNLLVELLSISVHNISHLLGFIDLSLLSLKKL
jgi:hypothetical protein